MAIVNRDLDASEQKQIWMRGFSTLTTTGGTYMAFIAPYAIELKDIYVSAKALSGAPTLTFYKMFFSGGASLVAASAALTVSAYGTSGIVRASLVAAGSTAIQLAANDVLVIQAAVSNAGMDDAVLTIVAKALQDIKAPFGSSS